MAKFSFHCENYKAGQLGGIDRHNRRLNKHYISNSDINKELSKNNRIYIAPKRSLYKDCKEQIEKRVCILSNELSKKLFSRNAEKTKEMPCLCGFQEKLIKIKK